MRFLFLILFFMTQTDVQIYEQLIIKHKSHIIDQIQRKDLSFIPLDLQIIDESRMEQIYQRIEDEVFQAPIDAELDEQGNIIDEKKGYKVDKTVFYERLQEFYYHGIIGVMEVPQQTLFPKVTSELLAHVNQHKIGSYTTYYKTEHSERSHNIFLATEAINNTVIFPGEQFSFNQIVGERTTKKGYKRAPVIVKGELSEDIGGGICQVSSTLFNAVNLRGVQMIERYSHSKEVPYVPPGKDATVSWWGPDFVFKNNYKEPLLIRAFAENGRLDIHVFAPFKKTDV